jgi:hypothetical protein
MKNKRFVFLLVFISFAKIFARDLPINREEFELWNDVFQITFDGEIFPRPDYNENDFVTYKDNDDNFSRRVLFYHKNLYQFVFTEFSDFFSLDEDRRDWSWNYDEIKDDVLEIFNNAIGSSLGISEYITINNTIGIIHEYREFPNLVGLIKSTENLITKFNVPLSIDGSQDIFGRPDYYVVEKNRPSKKGIVITVYEFSRSRIIFIFKDRFLKGVCFIN